MPEGLVAKPCIPKPRRFHLAFDMSVAVEIRPQWQDSSSESRHARRGRNIEAQKAFGVRKGRLMNSSGVVLDVSAAITDSGVQNGGSLTLHINRAQASATAGGFCCGHW